MTLSHLRHLIRVVWESKSKAFYNTILFIQISNFQTRKRKVHRYMVEVSIKVLLKISSDGAMLQHIDDEVADDPM